MLLVPQKCWYIIHCDGSLKDTYLQIFHCFKEISGKAEHPYSSEQCLRKLSKRCSHKETVTFKLKQISKEKRRDINTT